MNVQDTSSQSPSEVTAGPAAESSSWRLRRALSLLGGAFLGVVLLFSTWAKAIDPSAFVDQISSEGLDFLLPAVAVAVIALALEAGLGLLLILGVRRVWNLVPTAGLVAFFVFLTARNLLEGCERSPRGRSELRLLWQASGTNSS